jgi:hypothetical protein
MDFLKLRPYPDAPPSGVDFEAPVAEGLIAVTHLNFIVL